ncbi:hypothetical protein [Flectobacillus roseus]|uniref:hypothetical protein n=1 Tax=Flectobacillus roseus TaxID=502259 RepID=UPI0024B7035A|nr:hypothetical protein [Flectobacillus roseus]MDI9868568.1 hypothetical protein [Flectobacillus roseus]
MIDTRPVIILAFANSPSSPLDYLSEEIKRCNAAFNNISGKFQIRYLYEATIEDIQNAIDETASRVVGFMYSGHANEQAIDTIGHGMSAIGLASQLSRCPNLIWVLLNGCCTGAHFEYFKVFSIPIFVGTQAPVNDQTATWFSTTFLQELTNGADIANAFQTAIEKAQAYSTTSITRETRFLDDDIPKTPTNTWLLIVLTAEYLTWKLSAISHSQLNYIPNSYLKEFLYEKLSEWDDNIAGYESFEDAQGDILAKFPPFISKQIHNLCASRVEGITDSGEYFDQPTIERIGKMVGFYTAVQEIFLSIALAELRDCFIDRTINYTQYNNPFFFNQPARFNKIEWIIKAIEFKQTTNILFFIEEIQELRTKHETLSALGQFFEELSLFYQNANPNTAVLEQKSLLAEQKLVSLLSFTLFLTQYKFVSVKNIVVFKNRSRPQAKFDYKLSVYEWKGERQENPANLTNLNLHNEIPDNFSILIIKALKHGFMQVNMNDHINKQLKSDHYLNISPFIIDPNVIYDKAPISNISFLDVYSENRLTYRSLYKVEDRKSIENNKEMKVVFNDLQEQFKDFKKLLNP